jgi:hypothetical protein
MATPPPILIDVAYQRPPHRVARLLGWIMLAIVGGCLPPLVLSQIWTCHEAWQVLFATLGVAVPATAYYIRQRAGLNEYLESRMQSAPAGDLETFAKHLLADPEHNNSNLIMEATKLVLKRAVEEQAWGTTVRIAHFLGKERAPILGTQIEPRPIAAGAGPQDQAEEQQLRPGVLVGKLFSVVLAGIALVWVTGMIASMARSAGGIWWVLLIAGLVVLSCLLERWWRRRRLVAPQTSREAPADQSTGDVPPLQPKHDIPGEWWLVPGGVVLRRARGMRSQVELFPRKDSIAVTRPTPQTEAAWVLTIARRDGSWTTSEFGPLEMDAFLQAWLSPLDPPEPDRLTDLE